MSEQSTDPLAEIKARAAAPAAIYETWHHPHRYVTALQESQADVMRLVALVEKIRDDTNERAAQFLATTERLWEQVRTRHPERSLDDAQRYEAYSNAHRAAAHFIQKAIEEELQ